MLSHLPGKMLPYLLLSFLVSFAPSPPLPFLLPSKSLSKIFDSESRVLGLGHDHRRDLAFLEIDFEIGFGFEIELGKTFILNGEYFLIGESSFFGFGFVGLLVMFVGLLFVSFVKFEDMFCFVKLLNLLESGWDEFESGREWFEIGGRID